MKINDKILQKIWDYSSRSDFPSPPPVDEAWDLLEQRMSILDHETKTDRPSWSIPTFLIRPKFAFATLVALFFIISTPIALKYFNTESVMTNRADLKTLQLADGSFIQLNHDSRVSYKKDFNSDHRTIQLEGEAFFSVDKSTIPFVIETELGNISVLGTSFNVKSREGNLEVGVNTGVVEVLSQNKSYKLKPGQFVKIKKNKLPSIPGNLPYDIFPAWLENKLVFQETNLLEATQEIERIFDITFEFDDPTLKSVTITGIINTDNLETVLSSISFLTQRDYKFNRESRTCIIK